MWICVFVYLLIREFVDSFIRGLCFVIRGSWIRLFVDSWIRDLLIRGSCIRDSWVRGFVGS